MAWIPSPLPKFAVQCKAMRVLDLFAGTGSWARWAAEQVPTSVPTSEVQVHVTSLDIRKCRAFEPDIVADLLTWDYRAMRPGEFDIVWASPPCTQYSNAKRKGVRDLEGADKLVRRALDVIAHLRPRAWFIENPYTGKLRHRDIMHGLPYRRVDYCAYGRPYRKPTCIWTNVEAWTGRRCPGLADCPMVIPDSLCHKTAIRGQRRHPDQQLMRDKGNMVSVGAIPPELIRELVQAVVGGFRPPTPV